MTAPQNPQPPQGQPPRPQGQPSQGQPPVPPGGAVAMPQAPKPSLLKAFMPDPAKAPPLEWVALIVGIVLAVSAFLPWATNPDELGTQVGSGNGWLIFGAALASVVMGFIGLSRDSISLAVGQALIGLLSIILVLVQDISPGDDRSLSFGIYVALISAAILILLSAYNAVDALRKGAKY
jgi:hypothetical protein